MATDLEVCNRALDAIGTPPIAAISDGSRASDLCGRYFSQIKDDVLRSHPWNCAMKRIAINADVDPPAFGYGFRYLIPADCLRVLRVMGDEEPGVDWQVESGVSGSPAVDGTFIVTDEGTPLQVIYTARVATTLLDPMLVSAIAARLAMELAQPLTGSPDIRQQMEREYVQRLRAARSADGQEGTPLQVSADDFRVSRL